MESSTTDQYNVAWDLFSELRKETLESQKIRTQAIGFKITFVGTAIGVIASNPDKISSMLLVIPAFAAMFFDLLITSYSFSIKRIGHYCRTQLEPRLRAAANLPTDFIFWHEFLQRPSTQQSLARFGNVGITFLALAPAVLALCRPFDLAVSTPLLASLFVLFCFDVKAHATIGEWRNWA